MSTFDRTNSRAALVIAGAAFGLCGMQAEACDARKGPDLGVPLNAKDVAAIDLAIAPDGGGLANGSGNGGRGSAVYAEQCAACHGQAGVGGVGGIPRRAAWDRSRARSL
jgi:cytochrome c5